MASVSSASTAPAAASGISLLAGIEVSVEGGTATTFTDASGHFRLEVEAEDAGTVVLRFRRALLDVLIEIDGVTPGATIRFAVSLTGAGGTVIHRDDDDEGLSFSVKLPHSRDHALTIPGSEPTHYGLGAKGWVTLRPGARTSFGLLAPLIEESYRAVAPKRVLEELDAGPAAGKRPRKRA